MWEAAHMHDLFTSFLHEAHLPGVGIHMWILLDAALVCTMDLVGKDIQKQLRVGRGT